MTKPLVLSSHVSVGYACRELHMEDRILVNPEAGLYGVFDGVSVNGGGADAATMAVEAVNDWVTRHLLGPVTVEQANALLADAFRQADTRIAALNGARNAGGRPSATTAAVVLILQLVSGRVAVVATLGDSRVNLLRGGQLYTLTLDHSFVQDTDEAAAKARQDRLDAAGSIEDLNDPMDRAAFSYRNVISSAIQGSGTRAARFLAIELKTADRLVIDSDGIHDNLTHAEMASVLSSEADAQSAASAAAAAAWERSQENHETVPRAKPDDMSIVVVDLRPL